MRLSVPSAAKQLINDSTTAYRLLNGLICLYKPESYHSYRVIKELRHKLCQDLNQMAQPPRETRVLIRRVPSTSTDNHLSSSSEQHQQDKLENEKVLASWTDGHDKHIEVVQGLGYHDHPGVIGSGRWKPKDLKIIPAGSTTTEVSGVHLYGIGPQGILLAKLILHGRWLRTYHLSGRFGISTHNLFRTGRIVEKSTWKSIKPQMFERLLMSMQATNQKLAYQASQLQLDTEMAYQLAASGELQRPEGTSQCVVYGLKLLEWAPPHWKVEVKCVNEDTEYLKLLVLELGHRCHSTAVTEGIRCVKVGPFGEEDAVLDKHWGVEGVLKGVQKARRIMDGYRMWERGLTVTGDGAAMREGQQETWRGRE